MRQCGCNITGAPLVVKDKVIVGVTGGDSAHRGYISAFDARTGRLAWRFWTIPGPGEKGHETWTGDSWKHGGGSTWMTGSYDAELNLIYWGVGNPAADFYGDSRKGDNLYTDSVVALDADTGKLKWHYQQIPHDVWDLDTAYECVLLDLPVNGKTRKLLLNINKGGYTFVVDRTNGEFVSAWPVVENINWIKGCQRQGQARGTQRAAVGDASLICPSIGGGRQWNQGAYSAKSGWFYTAGIEWCQEVTVHKEQPKEGMNYFGGVFQLRHPPAGKATDTWTRTIRSPARKSGRTGRSIRCSRQCFRPPATWCSRATRKGTSSRSTPAPGRSCGAFRQAPAIAAPRSRTR